MDGELFKEKRPMNRFKKFLAALVFGALLLWANPASANTKITLLSISHPSTEDIVEVWFQVSFSGNYVTGGDTLDLTTLAGQVSSNEGSIMPTDVVNIMPVGIHVDSQTGGWGASGGGYYEVKTYTNVSGGTATVLTPKTTKIQLYSAGGTEATGGSAYPATAVGDYVVCVARWPRKP
jgi:hypothetical protein